MSESGIRSGMTYVGPADDPALRALFIRHAGVDPLTGVRTDASPPPSPAKDAVVQGQGQSSSGVPIPHRGNSHV